MGPTITPVFRSLARSSGNGSTQSRARGEAQGLTAQGKADLVTQRYEQARRAKYPMLRTWATCLAFYVGEHWRTWDQRAQRLVQPAQLPSWRLLLTDNQIPGSVEIGASKLSRSRQKPRALPDTEDEEDKAGAQAGTKALDHWWAVDEMDWKELAANIHRIIFGAAFFHDYWDPQKSAKIALTDPYSGRLSGQRAPVGDETCRILSVFEVFPQPGIKDHDRMGWMVLAEREPISAVKDQYGEKADGVQSNTATEEAVLDWIVPGATGISGADSAGNGAGNTPDEGFVTKLTYYEAVSPRFPQGRHLVVANRQLLFEGEMLPDPHAEIPVSQFAYRYVPERYWPMGNVESLIGLQRELNLTQSYMAENLRLFGRPQRVVDKNARIPKESLTTSPDEIIEATVGQGRAIEFLTPPALPLWVSDRDDKIRAAMNQVSGNHEVSNAQNPSGVTAASALRLLQEADDTRLAVPALLGKRGLQKLSQHVLTGMVERYREPRLIQTLGRGQVRQAQALTGADIGHRDVLVEITEGVADTLTIKTEDFRAWWQSGFIQGVLGGQVPWEFGEQVFSELGAQWIVEALAVARQVVEQQQANAVQQAEEQQAGLNGQPNPQAENAQAQAEAAQQQAETQQLHQTLNAHADRQHQAEQADAGRQHAMQMEVLKAVLAQHTAQQKMQPSTGVR